MKVNTELYRDEKGTRPSGEGGWVFSICRRPGESTTFTTSGKYADAVRAVKIEARQIGGVSDIILQP